MLRQIAHGIGIDVFEFGGNGGTLCQFGQSGLIVKCGAQMAVGKFGGGGVGIGIKHGYAVTHGFGGNGKHSAELAAAEDAQHGGREDGCGHWVARNMVKRNIKDVELLVTACRRFVYLLTFVAKYACLKNISAGFKSGS